MSNYYEEQENTYGSSAQRASRTGKTQEDTIGDWSVSRLLKFMAEAISSAQSGTNKFDSLYVDQMFVDDIFAVNNTQTTVGATGSADALPANPVKYIRIVDDTGTVVVIPAYNP